MPIKRETGKDRWSRISKDYFRSRDQIQTAKHTLALVAVVVSVGWWLAGMSWRSTEGSSSRLSELNSLRANHGELNRVHSAWAQKCDACHVPFEPIDGRPILGLLSSTGSRASDQQCSSCHAGPTHHQTQIASEVVSCASCHRDHQGANFSLVDLPDTDCTSCHSALAIHIAQDKKPKGERQYGDVKMFGAETPNHPPFRPQGASFAEGKPPVDNSKLKFSHARHMMPGIVKKVGDIPYKVEDIPVVAERARYAKSPDLKSPVQLDCASCHVLDSQEVKGSPNPGVASTSLPSRSAGQYFLPATFEHSCRACHTLTVLNGKAPLEVPHGVQPAEVVSYLERAVSGDVLSAEPGVLNSFVPSTKIPGKPAVSETVRAKRDQVVNSALKALFPAETNAASSNANNCAECHYYGPTDNRGVPSKVEPTNVPEIWFTHAKFDHTAHRGVSCRDCHSRSYAMEADGKTPVKDASWVATDYLNPGIDNCVQCHAPAPSAGWTGGLIGGSANATGGASFNCTECHRYHNGDKPLEGLGASARNATASRSITEFLQGAGGSNPTTPGK